MRATIIMTPKIDSPLVTEFYPHLESLNRNLEKQRSPSLALFLILAVMFVIFFWEIKLLVVLGIIIAYIASLVFYNYFLRNILVGIIFNDDGREMIFRYVSGVFQRPNLHVPYSDLAYACRRDEESRGKPIRALRFYAREKHIWDFSFIYWEQADADEICEMMNSRGISRRESLKVPWLMFQAYKP
ncbi:MAG: hypothetical protein ABIR47_12275 [Candidatus Kapaibacterium sp.]